MAQTQNNGTEKSNREVTFEIMQHFGVLSTSPRGWTKELNLVSWNDSKPKYDLRDWDGEHRKMSRGITLTEDETNNLRAVLNEVPLTAAENCAEAETELFPDQANS